MAVETRKILDPDIDVTATCVRVPVFIGHAEAINIEFVRPITVEQARAALRDAPGVSVLRVLDLSRLAQSDETFVVVASRGQFDEEALEQALNIDAFYVALLANKRRAQEIQVSLREKGIAEEKLAEIHVPAGLDIGAITPAELSGGTFTVSNLGMFGVSSFGAIINPPQAAILAVGELRELPVVRGGQVVPGSRMSIALTCDHRILYGAPAAEFLARIRQLLEQPINL